ncbi:unnamed protein product [Ilex paraguariensis]|uniref:Uncharacterized protein n=1 Tax=Ilex paraguariensis TaxID=185542 RepID=A0ABC8ULF8_9AQUA
MSVHASNILEDQKEEQSHLVEVANAEKQLWALINSKGPLHEDVQALYRKVRDGYEDIILNDHETVEFQDVEYSLWKLHYKHIDEFRKRIRQSSADENMRSGTPQDVASMQNIIDNHMEGFKSFLSEAAQYYQNLITELRRCYELPEEPLLYRMDGGSVSVEPAKLLKYRYSCHRFYVCLGDLARYQELCKKLAIQNCDWSLAASYYLEATMIWPDSGNPHNQLALLATYIGDDFLALYHCVRSLAVKEPFPDAWDNLKLLFETNSSSCLHLLSTEAAFDFLKPSERSSSWMKSNTRSGSLSKNKVEAAEYVCSGETDLWPLFVRMISFFFVRSSDASYVPVYHHCNLTAVLICNLI